jgi:uracil-DNA glycosylase
LNALAEPLARVLDRAPASWAALVQAWRISADGQQLEAFVAQRQAEGATVYPADPLRALALTPRHDVRVAIVGQDPYHGPGQAEGLAFSVPPGIRPPPSLRNIFKEQSRDLGLPLPAHGHLGAWARRGVLLLNSTLTVEDGQPGIHAGRGWEALTDAVIQSLCDDERPKVFMLWGAHAQRKGARAPVPGCHAVLTANHPSPLSATRGPTPFLGCGHFGACNRFFADNGEPEIDWSLD